MDKIEIVDALLMLEDYNEKALALQSVMMDEFWLVCDPQKQKDEILYLFNKMKTLADIVHDYTILANKKLNSLKEEVNEPCTPLLTI